MTAPNPLTPPTPVTAPARKLPLLEPRTAFFWTSGADGVLRIQRCGECGRYQHPPRALCASCHGDAVAPAPVSGRGRVKTFTINYEAWLPGLSVPFVLAAIELDEQAELYVLSNVLAPVDSVAIGDRVDVTFAHQDDVWIPLFRPIGDAS